MHFALNTPFFTQASMRREDSWEIYLIEKIRELGIDYIRIPVFWCQLLKTQGNKIIWDNAVVNKYRKILDILGKDVKVLGFTLNPPHKVAIDYFHDRASITENYTEFLKGCLQLFPEINEWEVWNEPNASDFYLSLPDGKGHRPWTPNEFIHDVLIPGAKTIRAAKPNATICVAGLAENGIVGHYDKTPALSNRLPKNKFFNSLRGQGVHDHFYFIPEFGYQFFKDLKQVILERHNSGKAKLFDACAFHPYPYFMLHKKTDPDLLRSSIGLIKEFNQMFDEANIDDLQVWITEVGARSFDVSNRHFRDELIQSNFIKDLPQQKEILNNISRIYWYKLIDRPFDLRQEKSFGVLDHNGNPKKSFFELKKLCRESRKTLSVYRDSFAYGDKFDQGSFDSIDWDAKASTEYGFATVSSDRLGNNFMLLSPGRYKDDYFTFQSKTVLSMSEEFYLDFELGYEIATPDVDFQLDIKVQDVVSNAVILQISLKTEKHISLEVHADNESLKATIAPHYSFANSSTLKALKAEVLKDRIVVSLDFIGGKLLKTFFLKTTLSPVNMTMGFFVTKLIPRRGFVQITSITARTQPKKQLSKTLPTELGISYEDWTFQLPRISQIHQDEWILRATRFKRQGYFVEIGGHDGIANSNTVNLERLFGWNGIIIEANPRLYKEICQNRSCIAANYAAFSQPGQELEFVDAGAVGGSISHLQNDIHTGFRQQHIKSGSVIKVPSARGDEILTRYSAPEYIEYISVDTEGSELEVLKSIDFKKWKVGLLTIEHGGQEDKRQDIWEYMRTYGYERIRVWFEDWYYHIPHLAKILGIDESETQIYLQKTNAFIPYQRRTNLLKSGLAARQEGKSNDALNFFLEATKDYYPDNIHAYIEATTEYQRQKKFQKAIDTLNEAAKKSPNHSGLLKKSVNLFANHHRYVLLTRVLERIMKQHPKLIQDEDISSIVFRHRDNLISIFQENPSFKQQNYNIAQYLMSLVLK